MVNCPICDWKGDKFLPYGKIKRENAVCPECGAKERHRLLGLYLKKTLDDKEPMKLLHFSPEKCLANLLKSYKNIDYISADLNPERAMTKQDITHMDFENNLFDMILCVDVLEHIPDDLKAMRELHRVLKPRKYAILQVPIHDADKTFEDFSITSPEDKEKYFYQKDHVRVYGRDYRDRLRKAGFNVKVDRFIDSLEEEEIEKFALIMQGASKERHYINLCTK